MTCELCVERGKTWNGDDPTCAFENTHFSDTNWNCATVNKLRDIVYEGQKKFPVNVDYRYCEDQKYATIQIDDLDGVDGALALWMTWYKSRGRTEGAWLLFSDRPPRLPTEKEIVSIVNGIAKLSVGAA